MYLLNDRAECLHCCLPELPLLATYDATEVDIQDGPEHVYTVPIGYHQHLYLL